VASSEPGLACEELLGGDKDGLDLGIDEGDQAEEDNGEDLKWHGKKNSNQRARGERVRGP
jgi:hypothetical protein